MGQRSRVLPMEAAGMLEAARHAKRLRDPVEIQDGWGIEDMAGGQFRGCWSEL